MKRARARGERGATALELGLVAPVMILLMFAVLQYGYHYWSLTTASATAREAARRMSVGHDWTTCAQPWIADHAGHPAVDPTTVLSTHRYVDVVGATVPAPRVGDRVEVTVTFTSLHLGIPVLPLPGLGEVTQTASARVENVPDSVLPCAGPGNP